ncbi:transcription factor ILR3 [Citrus sinensis]|uniref:Transcription factor ILR3 n=1 Tax=Citrus sinensis TaxID=2711 RepID=A0ACB8NZQ6_CITSI|nr:transcription factor ILR3 [Citrus sinensis]KAH9803289.1 transcription factor ILR3 [Citrus sinensis]
MVSPENTNWLLDYPLIDDITVPDGNFSVSASGFTWTVQPPINGPSNGCVEIDSAFGDSNGLKESSKKRVRSESCGSSSSKACREKLRRDRLNDKFVELASILEPGRPPKTDKAAILIDAVRMAEKNELRDEKQRLKAEKEKIEQQLKAMSTQPSFLTPPPAIPAAFAAQGQAPGNKLMPFISYPGVAMWQFMPPAAVDTSQDHVLRPPVA